MKFCNFKGHVFLVSGLLVYSVCNAADYGAVINTSEEGTYVNGIEENISGINENVLKYEALKEGFAIETADPEGDIDLNEFNSMNVENDISDVNEDNSELVKNIEEKESFFTDRVMKMFDWAAGILTASIVSLLYYFQNVR